jgi:hypothetical protein
MSIQTEISVGEFVDKLTILQIKADRIKDPAKLVNINNELQAMLNSWQNSAYAGINIEKEMAALRQINEKLWEIEDDIREQEAKADFGDRFVELARSVYINNDRRAELKKRINMLVGSDLAEEKSYRDYHNKLN